MELILQIEGLNFEYANRALFRQFKLGLGAGITWLRGENGAGKTTLLKLAGGALAPHTGTIRLDELELHTQPLAYRLRCYYCGGDTPQLPWLTVREVLDLHLSLYPATDAALLNAELDAFHLMAALDQPVTTLSLGQHKKMQLSLALALPVRLLLIDEPFNGLDADAVAYLRQQLSAPERLARQCVLLTSHLDPALPLAQTIQL
jgi:ABC-2 type transport system ATP-binding protein